MTPFWIGYAIGTIGAGVIGGQVWPNASTVTVFAVVFVAGFVCGCLAQAAFK